MERGNSEHTNEDDAAGVFRVVGKPAGQLEDASNGLVCLSIILALNSTGLENQEESIHMLGDGLRASAPSQQKHTKIQYCRTKQQHGRFHRTTVKAESTRLTYARDRT